MERDKYDEAVEHLTANPHGIEDSWEQGECLFQHAGKESDNWGADGYVIGCLTQIREGWVGAATPELTAAIRADARLPVTPTQITVEMLPIFAEWQRKIDAMGVR